MTEQQQPDPETQEPTTPDKPEQDVEGHRIQRPGGTQTGLQDDGTEGNDKTGPDGVMSF